MCEVCVYLTQMSVCRSGKMVYNCVYRSGLTVVNAVLGVLSRLSLWWKADVASVESKMMSLTLLMKLILIDASVLSNSQHPAFAIIWSMYTGLLTDRTTTLAFKVWHYLSSLSSLLLQLMFFYLQRKSYFLTDEGVLSVYCHHQRLAAVFVICEQ